MRLNDAGIAYDAINYVIEPPSREKLAELVRKMGVRPREVMRTKEAEFRELGLGEESVGDEALLDAMAEHPGLIQRPILEYGDRAALARPAESVDGIIEAWKLDQTN